MGMSPRTSGFVIGSLLGIVIIGLGAWAVNTWLKGGDIDEVAERLPDDTLALFAFRGFADLYLEFDEELKSIADSKEAEEGVEQFEKVFGINPLDPDSLEETGFSFSSPWAMATLGDPGKNQLDIVTLIPIEDPEIAADFIDDQLDELNVEIEEEEVEDLDAFVANDNLAWVIDGDYLIACVPVERPDDESSSRSEEALDCLEDLLKLDSDETLAATENFERARELADPDWNLLFYTTTEWLTDIPDFKNEAPEPVADFIHDVVERCPAHVSTLSIEREGVTARSTNILNSEYAHLFAMDGSDDLADRIPGEAVALGRTSLHVHAIWSVLMDWDYLDDEAGDFIDKVEDRLDIDLEDDLIANFTGHFSLAVLEAEKNGELPVNIVSYAPVEDEDLALDIVEDVIDAFEDRGMEFDSEDAGNGVYFVHEDDPEFCLGVARDHMVLAVGKGQCESTFEGIDDGGESFLDELPGEVRDGLEDGTSTYGFVSIPALVDLVKSTSGQLRSDERVGLNILEDLMESVEFNSWTEEGASTYEFIVHPPEGDFGPGLEALAEGIAESM